MDSQVGKKIDEISVKTKIIYWIVFLISVITFILPIFIVAYCSRPIQQFISGISNISFIYGLSSPLTAIISIFGSIFFGVSLGFVIYLVPYIWMPRFRECEKRFFKTSVKFYDLEKFDEKLDTIQFKLLICFTIISVGLGVALCLCFNDFTVVNEKNIYQKYLTTTSNYDWKNIEYAQINLKYFLDKNNNTYDFYIDTALIKNNQEIFVWKDNGVTKPTLQELLWLFDKIKRENITIKITPISNDILANINGTNKDFRIRIYPALKSILSLQ